MKLDQLPPVLSEARPPACGHSALDHWAWTAPVGISAALGYYGLTFGRDHVHWATAAAFLAAAAVVFLVYRWVAECPQHKSRRSQW